MTDEKEEILRKEETDETTTSDVVTIDVKDILKDLYRHDPKDLRLDISAIAYSNLANINVSSRDVYIDFLEMPGIMKDGIPVVTGTRIYLSHVAAQKLAKALSEVLEHVHSKGDMEKYQSEKERETKSD
ncbi:MAG: DUF3467 domain-containing protein [Halobacteriota archaeon]